MLLLTSLQIYYRRLEFVCGDSSGAGPCSIWGGGGINPHFNRFFLDFEMGGIFRFCPFFNF